jgi:hypothetical protein
LCSLHRYWYHNMYRKLTDFLDTATAPCRLDSLLAEEALQKAPARRLPCMLLCAADGVLVCNHTAIPHRLAGHASFEFIAAVLTLAAVGTLVGIV